MNGFLAWLQSVGHTLKGWVGFMTPDEWIVLGMVIAALALAMTGTSVTRKVKRKRRVRRADTTSPSVAQEKEKSEQPESEETVVDAQQEPAQTQKDERSEQQANQETAAVAENRFEEPATVVEDDNLSMEVGSHSSEMVPALEEVTPSSIEEPLSAPTHISDAPTPTSVEPTDDELLVNKPAEAEAPELVREEDYPAQEQSQEEEAVPVTEESPSVQEQSQEEEIIQAEPDQAAEQSDVDVAEVPPSQPQVTADQEHKPFKPKRRQPAQSIAVSYDANAQKQSRGRGARREDIASLTGGGDTVAAKLNLARVYSDTGDSREAQQLLQEVLKEGSDAQQRAAKAYLEKLQQREDT